ncbi:hypothetical protein CMI37_12380 [Candidatus Pacearchaeota archaeon]|nr:hypothetical protein [Candidatus Pacearchaeota archaeon]|tara:strand:- start:210 stop:581 length:372 start_codon:yes stop_codon:yes gene_type:complete
MAEEEPPDNRNIQPHLWLPWTACSPRVIPQIYRHKCNGNLKAVKDFLDRIGSLANQHLIITAKRDGEKRYQTSGVFLPGFFYNQEGDKVPSGIVLEQQTQQGGNLYYRVYFDRIHSATPIMSH